MAPLRPLTHVTVGKEVLGRVFFSLRDGEGQGVWSMMVLGQGHLWSNRPLMAHSFWSHLWVLQPQKPAFDWGDTGGQENQLKTKPRAESLCHSLPLKEEISDSKPHASRNGTISSRDLRNMQVWQGTPEDMLFSPWIVASGKIWLRKIQEWTDCPSTKKPSLLVSPLCWHLTGLQWIDGSDVTNRQEVLSVDV